MEKYDLLKEIAQAAMRIDTPFFLMPKEKNYSSGSVTVSTKRYSNSMCMRMRFEYRYTAFEYKVEERLYDDEGEMRHEIIITKPYGLKWFTKESDLNVACVLGYILNDAAKLFNEYDIDGRIRTEEEMKEVYD